MASAATARSAPLSAPLLALARDGYCILEQAQEPAQIAALARDLDPHFEGTAPSQGAFSGAGTRRFGRLLLRSDRVAALVEQPQILEIVEAVLGRWCDHVALNLTQAIDLMPGAQDQVPHRDQDMWPCSQWLPAEQGIELLVNILWPLTPFTADNGATRLWPGSHRRRAELLIDPHEAVIAKMMPGTALIFLGSTLHVGGANKTALPRRGLIISYCLGWLKPYELPWLAYPPEIARRFPPSLAALAGYRVHRPNLGVYEGCCPSRLLTDETGPAGVVDALLPHQEELIAAWRSGRVTARDFRAGSAS